VRSLRIISPVIITLAAAVVLSGCALFPAVQEVQTKVTACLELKDALLAVGEDINAASGDLVDDPQAGADKIADVAVEFRASAEALTNAEVRDAAVESADALDEFSAIINDYAVDPASTDLDALSASGEKVTTLMAGLDEVCSA
jgi:hypothetical protein